MNPYLKNTLRALTFGFSVISILGILFVFSLILINGYAFFVEPNTFWLLVEMVLFGFGLILQFVPLKDKVTKNG